MQDSGLDKVNLENLPLSGSKFTKLAPYKLEVGLGTPCVFEITVNDWKLSITELSICPV